MDSKLKVSKVFFAILFSGVIMFYLQNQLFAANIEDLNYQKRKITIHDKEITVWVADDEAKRILGLQNILKLPKDCGMLFVFDKPDLYCFWNKNTFLNLKLIFMNKGVIVQESKLPAIKNGSLTVCTNSAADSVLEIEDTEEMQNAK
jgi:uncharacterized membrane protein (UPF0127 family)